MKKPKVSELSLREKIGQTALVAQGRLLEYFTTTEEICEHLKKYPCGGLWVQGASNVGDMNLADAVCEGFSEKNYVVKYANWVERLNGALDIPLLTGTDAESGGHLGFPELTQVSTATGFGAANSEELTYEEGVCVASECRYPGVNWIWGPVVDLHHTLYGCLHGRTFSNEDAKLVEKLAIPQIKGIQSCRSAAAVKHFPGIGKKDYRDSHGSHTVNFESFEEWEKEQGAIFQKAIDEGVWSVMVGHTCFPAVDDAIIEDNYIPATLSHKIITGLLKGKMGFDGVVITDGIGMKGLRMTYDTKKLYVELLKAGNDVILGIPHLEVYYEAIEEALANGELSEERLDDACRRILDLKEKVGLFDDEKPEIVPVPEELLERTRNLAKKVAEKSLTQVCDKNKQIPLSKEKVKKVVGIYLGYSNPTYERLENILKEEFAKYGAEFKLQRYLDPVKCHDEADSGIKVAEENDLLLYFADLPNGSCNFLTGETWRTSVFSLVHGNEKSIVVALRSPFAYYDYFTYAKTFVCTFGTSNEVLRALVAGLYGDLPFDGKMPVNLIPDYAR